MKNITLLLLIISLVACQQYPIPKQQQAASEKGVVAAAHPLAAHAGRQMLAKGGNAADAAVAAGFALAVVEPSMSGLGGRLQAIMHLPNGEIHGIDATTQSPIGYDTAVFKPQRFGYTTIGIPGVVAGLCKLLEERGTMTLSEVMAPAIQYAEEGFKLLPGEARRHAAAIDQIKTIEGSKKYFLQANGQTYPAGSQFVQKDLAETLKIIAKEGRKGFYEGKLAEQMAADIQANGGCVSLEDLKNYKALDSKIVKGNYRGYDLHGLWLPSFGAITIEILHILENFPMDQLSEAERAAATFQAMQLAYQDRQTQNQGFEVAKELTSKEYAAQIAAQIDLNNPKTDIGYLDAVPESWEVALGHTTHLSVVDGKGMTIALTQSIGPNMGSKVASPGLGFLYAVTLGTYLRMYVPGQRVSSHISPFLVTKDGKPYMGLGAAGGSRIVTAIAQVISRVIDQDMALEGALAAPRVFPDNDKMLVETHAGLSWPKGSLEELMAKKYKIEKIGDPARFGRVHAIRYLKDKNIWEGAADPDWEGVAAIPKKK